MRGLSLLFAAVATCALHSGAAYRLQGSDDAHRPFVPYERGFVQTVHDPSAASGAPAPQGHARAVRVGDALGANRLFSCPAMVGPSDDGAYHCRSPAHGNCDRRSGTCFCREGYAGEDCAECAPTHVAVGGACHPKRPCPGDCSHAGRCDFLTGTCDCPAHRAGEDCARAVCTGYHRFCTHCNDERCLACEDGWSVDVAAPKGGQCAPCWRFDPRCRECNADACTACVDLLLLSVHRSGRRPQDPPLPVDELGRELSVAVPFGSQRDDAFYDAEHYFVVDPRLVPLNESSVECHQGLNSDASITCIPYNLTSHIMCGNHGTITFESPEYAVTEDERQIRLTLQRSGGGVGEVTVSYSIYPITAGHEDVTSTAYYTANQTVVFRNGQIKASFLVTINDDRLVEANETFSVHLSNPTGSARLGTQSRTIVTIIDDDERRTCSGETTLGHDRRDLGYAEAGMPFAFNVFAKTCAGNPQDVGGDVMKVEARRVGAGHVPRGFDAPATVGHCDDPGDGSYACVVNATASGNYEVDVYQLVPGGLKGFYFTDNYLSEERLDIVRTDAVVNFTWGLGAVTSFGRDFVSVRWEGYVRPTVSETYTFWLDVDDHARLWVDGILLIDSWAFSPTSGLLHAEHDLVALEAPEIVLEYREILGNATARLLWSSASTPMTPIPSSCLFYKEHIQNSPFSLTVLPGELSSTKTSAFGHGLYRGIAGKSHDFTIVPKDAFGNSAIPLDMSHLDQLQATAQLIDGGENALGNALVPVLVSYNDTGRTYEASYLPQIAGWYQLNVSLLATDGANRHIVGSPFLVETVPGATFAPESIAFGGYGHCSSWYAGPCPGTHHGIAGQNSTFYIQAFDVNRNMRKEGGDDWEVVVSSPDSADIYHIGSVLDHGNGTYSVNVVPTAAGENVVAVTMNGSPLKGSPFRMEVVHGPVSGPASSLIFE